MQRAKEIFWSVVEGICDALSAFLEDIGSDKD